MQQVILIQEDGKIVSNRLTNFVPAKGSTFFHDRTGYVVHELPTSIVSDTACHRVLHDAAVMIEALSKRPVTVHDLQLDELPDTLCLVYVRPNQPPEFFNELEYLNKNRRNGKAG